MNPLAARAAGLICTGCVSFIGLDFKLAPVLIGMSTAALIRVPMFKPKARLWAELSFTVVGVIGSFAIIADNAYGPGKAFATGIVMGAAASSLLEVGKSAFFSMIGDRMQAAGRVFFGVKGPDA
jgi:hypothetical protein